MARILKVYSTTNNSLQEFTFNSNEITWADVVNKINGNISNLIGRGRQSKVTYDLADAKISADDQIVFVGPKKMDSGIEVTQDTLDTLQELKEEFLEKVDNLFDQVLDEIKQEVEDQLEDQGNCSECTGLASEAKNMGFGK